MYNIFGLPSKKTPLREDEPPPKKLISEGDLFIKELSTKQLKTKISLEEQLCVKKEFTKSTEIDYLAKVEAGSNTLELFQNAVINAEEIAKLQSAGLSSFDIQLYNDLNNNDQAKIREKYKNIETSVMENHIERIQTLLSEYQTKKEQQCIAGPSRQKLELIETVKPNSFETKVLSYNLKNKNTTNSLPAPIDKIGDIEKQFVDDMKTFEKQNIKKIRKKARNLVNKINNMNETTPEPPKPDWKVTSLASKSKWDVKELSEIEKKPLKRYECKNQNFYTIVNGEIVPIHKKPTGIKRLTVEEIKSFPKFSNYEPGEPSNRLFLKNLSNSILVNDLKTFLPNDNIVSINLMKGRMKGQAFMEFTNVEFAEQALNTLNGLCFNNKPIIVQFGKQKIE